MKNPKIILLPDGLKAVEEPPKNKWYQHRLQIAIKEAIPFKEPEQVIIKMP